ncbi:MAG: hypothetical protein AAF249_13430 [Pseudomonadota bacterium]
MPNSRRNGVVSDGPIDGNTNVYELEDEDGAGRFLFDQWNPYFLSIGTPVTYQVYTPNPIFATKVRERSAVERVAAEAVLGRSVHMTPGGTDGLMSVIVDKLPPTEIDFDGDSREATVARETIKELQDFLKEAEQEGRSITFQTF